MIGYSLHGSGPVRAIALHGWFNDGHAFAPLLAGLNPEVASIATMDYRGYGLSRLLGGPYDMATVAADALALADHLGWDRFALIGHSMGGKAALMTAVQAPDRIERICAITPVWAAPAPFDPDTLAFFRSAAESIEAREAILNLSTGQRLPAIWARASARRSNEVSLAAAFAAYLESWALDDFADVARGVSQATLVVAGGHDAGVPLDWVRQTWLAQLPAAELLLLPQAGHYPMEECPLILASAITRFLASG